MNKKQKKVLVRILITAALLALLNLVQLPEIPAMILYLAAYLINERIIHFTNFANKSIFEKIEILIAWSKRG